MLGGNKGTAMARSTASSSSLKTTHCSVSESSFWCSIKIFNNDSREGKDLNGLIVQPSNPPPIVQIFTNHPLFFNLQNIKTNFYLSQICQLKSRHRMWLFKREARIHLPIHNGTCVIFYN